MGIIIPELTVPLGVYCEDLGHGLRPRRAPFLVLVARGVQGEIAPFRLHSLCFGRNSCNMPTTTPEMTIITGGDPSPLHLPAVRKAAAAERRPASPPPIAS